jgi:hypothetical protein
MSHAFLAPVFCPYFQTHRLGWTDMLMVRQTLLAWLSGRNGTRGTDIVTSPKTSQYWFQPCLFALGFVFSKQALKIKSFNC